MFSLKIEDIAKFKKITAFMKSFANECVLSVNQYGMHVKCKSDSNMFVLQVTTHELKIKPGESFDLTVDTEQFHKTINSLVGAYEFAYDTIGELTIQNSYSAYCIKLIDLEEVIEEVCPDMIYEDVQMLDSDKVVAGIKSAGDVGDSFVFNSAMMLHIISKFCNSHVYFKLEVEPTSQVSYELSRKQLGYVSKLSKLNKKVNLSLSASHPMRVIVLAETVGVATLYLQ